jgi:hypothetical protein
MAMLQTQDDDISDPGGEPPESDTHLGLVNPSTGLANDYLNVFNEILLLLEFLPTMPEMTEEALAWQPRTYCEYFEQSSIPGAKHALKAYSSVDPVLRKKFELVLARLTQIVVDAQATLTVEQASADYPDCIVQSCEQTAESMRIGLAFVNRLINEGGVQSAGASRTRNKKS